jgi:hypothetical protein
MKTAVEWLEEKWNNYDLNVGKSGFKLLLKQAKEMEKKRMIDLVQQLKEYTRESNNILGFDDREASEFVDIFYNQTFKSE